MEKEKNSPTSCPRKSYDTTCSVLNPKFREIT